MSLVSIFTSLLVIALFVWLVNGFFAMDGRTRAFLNGLVILGGVAWLLHLCGVLDGTLAGKLPRTLSNPPATSTTHQRTLP